MQSNGPRRYSADLPQGGLEIPCVLTFKGMPKDIEKVAKLLRSAATEGERKTANLRLL